MEQRMDSPEVAEEKQSLWMLTSAPLLWAAHFIACYLTAAVWCAKVAGRAGPLSPVRTAIGIYTVVALLGIAVAAWDGYRRHRFREAVPPHDGDTPEDRHRFLGLAVLLLSGLSAVAVMYSGLTALFFESCR